MGVKFYTEVELILPPKTSEPIVISELTSSLPHDPIMISDNDPICSAPSPWSWCVRVRYGKRLYFPLFAQLRLVLHM